MSGLTDGGLWQGIGRESMWEGEGEMQLEDVGGSGPALSHMAVAMTTQQLS